MKKVTLLLICAIAMCAAARAQSLRTIAFYARNYNGFSEKHKTRLKRYYLGYGVPFMNFNVNAHYVSTGDSYSTPPVPGVDITRKISVGNIKSFSATAGSFYPLIAVSNNNSIGFDIAVHAEAFQYTTGLQSFGSAFSVQDDCITEIFSLPVALVYKTGGEASLSKKDNVLFSMGCGIAPAFTASKVFDAQGRFMSRQFAMMEFGILTGIAWKIRVTYYSSVNLMNMVGGDPTNSASYVALGTVGTMDVTNKATSCVDLSLLILPFSWNWAKKNPKMW